MAQAGLKIHGVAKDDPELVDPPASTLLACITTLIYVVMEIEPWASCALGKLSTN